MRPLLCGVLLVLSVVAPAGQAQAPDRPTGTGSISGRILTSASQAIADATVVARLDANRMSDPWWATETDSTGAYRFDSLPAGPYIIVAAHEGFAGWRSIPTAVPAPAAVASRLPAIAFADWVPLPRRTIDLVPGGHATEINLTLQRPGLVSGRVITPTGQVAPFAMVRLYWFDVTGAIEGFSNHPIEPDGRFVITDVVPGNYGLGFAYVLPSSARLRELDVSTLVPVTVAEAAEVRNVDVPTAAIAGFSLQGRVIDTARMVPRVLRLEYGVPGTTHSGLLSVLAPDGSFQIRDNAIAPGPLTLIASGENDEGPVIGILNVTLLEGPNDLEVVVGNPGAIRGRVVTDGGAPLTAAGARLALVREGFTPPGAPDDVIEIAPDGWIEAGGLLGEYRVRVDQPRGWTVKEVRRRGLRLANDRLVIRNGETLDDLEIIVGPR